MFETDAEGKGRTVGRKGLFFVEDNKNLNINFNKVKHRMEEIAEFASKINQTDGKLIFLGDLKSFNQ
jgi:hypothetical protein